MFSLKLRKQLCTEELYFFPNQYRIETEKLSANGTPSYWWSKFYSSLTSHDEFYVCLSTAHLYYFKFQKEYPENMSAVTEARILIKCTYLINIIVVSTLVKTWDCIDNIVFNYHEKVIKFSLFKYYDPSLIIYFVFVSTW